MAGGGLFTVENPRVPGFYHNIHSFFHRALTAMPWYRDLELQGAEYVEPELNVALLLRDGRSLQWWTDWERTLESFTAFSARDARTLRIWAEEFEEVLERIILPESRSAPLEPETRRRLLARSNVGRRFLEISELSPFEFVQREFEHDLIRAGLLFFNGLREIDPRLPGFGHAIPALFANPRKAQMCIGGSARLAHALVGDIGRHGGDVHTGTRVRSILVQEGRAAGVELENGTQMVADAFVASGLNPHQTFLQLLPERAVPSAIRERAARFQYNKAAPLFSLHLALHEAPRYRAAERDPRLERAFMTILGLERFDQFAELLRAHDRGEFPPRILWGACPTLFDPTQAPAGKHTAFMWQKVPYALLGDPQNWEAWKESHGEELLEFWAQFAPNLKPDRILDRFTLTPLDTVRELPNMYGGDLLVGSFANGQIGYNRPFAGAGQYRTPLKGLYLCGGSSHPGGNITGLCGYNAAAVIAADLGLNIWWNPPRPEHDWRLL